MREHRGITVNRAVFLAATAAFSLVSTAQPSSTTTPQPDFAGIWNSATATPLERPAQFKNKEFFTPAEAAQWERRARAGNEEPATPSPNFVSYNALFREPGAHVVRSLRTSIVTDPADGRIPPLTSAAAAEKRRRQESIRHPNGAKDMGLQDRCLVFSTSGPPMLPYGYNSNYQFVQTANQIAINAEMGRDTRIIHLDRVVHLPAKIRQWLGDSIGHWQGDTLVVDTTNFNDGGGFYNAGGMFGWDRNLHVVERFRLLDADTILYQFEVDDPSAFTRPWKGELNFTRTKGPIYEYACHEGNYALPDLLNGVRVGERGAKP